MNVIPPGQTLFVDADDTLWENNIYFERAIATFIGYLDHREYSPAQVRDQLNAIERQSILKRGYGLKSFTASLVECYEQLAVNEVTDMHREQVRGFARTIGQQEIELLPGVAETLAALATRHRLVLMTKGDHAEQADKLSRSGLEKFFHGVEVVAEKDAPTYQAVLERYRLDQNPSDRTLGERSTNGIFLRKKPFKGITPGDSNSDFALTPSSAWMLGNSVKSDINPALAAGMNAVFLFHPNTWMLEHAELATPAEGQQLIELDDFAKLAEIF